MKHFGRKGSSCRVIPIVKYAQGLDPWLHAQGSDCDAPEIYGGMLENDKKEKQMPAVVTSGIITHAQSQLSSSSDSNWDGENLSLDSPSGEQC